MQLNIMLSVAYYCVYTVWIFDGHYDTIITQLRKMTHTISFSVTKDSRSASITTSVYIQVGYYDIAKYIDVDHAKSWSIL